MTGIRRLPDGLRVRARNMGDRVAHDDTRRVLTFAEWDCGADALGGGLAAAGLAPGDRVFLAISNAHAVEMAIAVMGVLRAGGIAVPLNTRLAKQEVSEYAELVGPRFAITDNPEQIAHVAFDRLWTVENWPRNEAALPDQDALDPEADAEILGTSGTTGRIKGVVISHPDLLGRVGDATAMDRSTSTLHALAFTGSGGNLGTLVLPIYGGATSYTQPQFDPGGFLKLVEEKQPMTVYLVPTMLRLVLDHPDAPKTNFSSVKYLLTGTAPLPHDSVVRAMTLWPHVSIRNSYGMSEGGIGAATRTKEAVLKPGCVGTMGPHMQIRDENCKPVPRGIVGEIYGKQPHPRRYWNDPAATRAGWVDGWIRTGDLGYVDEDGDLILTGRSKEVIIRGGYNIAPLEIEHVLHLHPAVKDAAAVGVSHPVLGEDVAAAVSLRPGAEVTPAELESWCRQRIASNKVPRTIVILPSLPQNQSAKILKRELKPVLEKAAAAHRAARTA